MVMVYRRLGHGTMPILDKLSKHDLVRDLPKHRYDVDQVWSMCAKGKQVRASFKPSQTISTSKPKLNYCI